MKTNEKELLLRTFKQRHNSITQVYCEISGISFQIVAPLLPNGLNFCYCGISPFSKLENLLQLAKLPYQELEKLAPSILAGMVISLLHHRNLRNDTLSAVEANAVLSQLENYQLYKVFHFLARLTNQEIETIPHISLSELQPRTLAAWYADAKDALNSPISEIKKGTMSVIGRAIAKASAKQGTLIIDSSIPPTIRAIARQLFKELKEDGLLPIKLQTILQISIQKNNLAMMDQGLRENLVKALSLLEDARASQLAQIIKKAGTERTMQETIISESLEKPLSIFEQPRKKTVAELLQQFKQKTQEQQQKLSDDFLSEIKEVEKEFLESQEEPSDDELLDEAEIEEINLSDDSQQLYDLEDEEEGKDNENT